MVKQSFQCKFGVIKVNLTKITITYVCFIVLTLAGSLRQCLSTRPIGLVPKQLPRDLQMLMHEKTCAILIFSHVLSGLLD